MVLQGNKTFDIKKMQEKTARYEIKRKVKEKQQEEKTKKKQIKKINKMVAERIKSGYYTLDVKYGDGLIAYKKDIEKYYIDSGFKVRDYTYSTVIDWSK